MTGITHDPVPTQPVTLPRGTITAGREYHQQLQGPTRRIGRGILVILLLIVGMFTFGGLLGWGFGLIDLHVFGRNSLGIGGTEYTPLFQLANGLSISLLIPWSMLLLRWFYGVRGGFLSSVRGALRPAIIGRALIVTVPIWAVYMAVFSLISPYALTEWPIVDLVALFVIVMVFTPYQSAAEEYGLRGLVFQVAASWGRGRRAALVLGIAVSAVVFAAIHVSADPWLNAYYLSLAIGWALITWRTGGLEWAIVMHAVNNTFAFILQLVMHTDPVAGGDRSAGVGSAIFALPILLMAAFTTVIWFRTRRTGPARTDGTTAE